MIIELPVVVSALAVVVATASAVISYRNHRREKLNQKILAAKWQKDYFADLLKWSDESLLLLSEALHLCDLNPKRCEGEAFFDSRHALRIKLSAQIDKGRWFFPNHRVDRHDEHKEGAYRGYRREVLNALVSAYRAVTDLNYVDGSGNECVREAIKTAKRKFTSEIQEVLAPGSRDAEFKELTRLAADA